VIDFARFSALFNGANSRFRLDLHGVIGGLYFAAFDLDDTACVNYSGIRTWLDKVVTVLAVNDYGITIGIATAFGF